jgi:hypothetical protein
LSADRKQEVNPCQQVISYTPRHAYLVSLHHVAYLPFSFTL